MRNIGIDVDSLTLLDQIVRKLADGFAGLPVVDDGQGDLETMRPVLEEVASRLTDNYPYFHPLYAGQMLKPPHPIARLAYMLSLYINPNNHALDGGRASSAMEKEAVAEIAAMFGWDQYLGHLAGGGTMANLEALWVAGRSHPDRMVLASTQAHYTHERLSQVLHLPFRKVPVDRFGRMDLDGLHKILDEEQVGTVVATIGTTATGAVDPLPRLLKLRDRYHFRIHADSAYGGYFRLVDSLPSATREVFDLLGEVDSIVVDPHKHGLQPYGCGCILFKDPSVGGFYKHDSPYTYFSSDELHLGEISLKCSRPGAAAVALWATQKLLPLERKGTFASHLAAGRNAAIELYHLIAADNRFLTAFPPELDIVIWLPKAASASKASNLSRQLFEQAAKHHLHLALVEIPEHFFDLEKAGMDRDRTTLTCLRSVLMKPEHDSWVGQIWNIVCQCLNELD